jgi:hypothetical protein
MAQKRIDDLELNGNLAEIFPPISFPISIAEKLTNHSDFLNGTPGDETQKLIKHLNAEMQPFINFLDAYFDPSRDDLKIEFDTTTLEEINYLALKLEEVEHLTDFGYRPKAFFDMARLQQMGDISYSGELKDEYTQILDRLSKHLTELLINDSGLRASNGLDSNDNLGNTQGPLDYMALRSRFGKLVASRGVDVYRVVEHCKSKIDGLHVTIESPNQ